MITSALWEEISTQYKSHDELILNLEQTPFKFVAVARLLWMNTGSNHIAIVGGSDKHCIT